jgi:class 3 adenylate cyclase
MPNTHVAEKGVLDLSKWDFDHDGNKSLDGQWEFYWGKLYTPEDFLDDSLLPPVSDYIKVPGYWNWQHFKNIPNLPSKGFATYRLRVKTNDYSDMLGLKILDMSSNYKLWVNGELVAENGNVSSNPEISLPQYLPMVKPFKRRSNEIEIIVQVSNYFHYKAGFWESISIGKYERLISKRNNYLFYDLFFIGSLMILFVYHLFIFLLRPKENAALWFGLTCFFIALRVLLINEYLFYIIFPHFSLNFGLRLEYLSILTLIPYCFAIFLIFLLGHWNKSKLAVKILTVVFSVETIIILFSPTIFYTSLLIYFQLVVLATASYGFYLSIIFLKSKKSSSVIFFISFIALFASMVNDFLYSDLIINTFYLAPYMFIFFLLVQAYILASNISNNYSEIEKLSLAIQNANQTLEQKVIQRTQDLEEEKEKANDLLLNILPEETANELKKQGRSSAKTYSLVTVLITDFKEFTMISEKVSAELLVAEIDYCFTAFDNIISKYSIEKIKTVGDSYICAGGLPVLTYSHAIDCIKAAQEFVAFIEKRKQEKLAKGEIPFEIRIGIHSGPVVAGIVGKKKFAYDIWGDTVNVASRMESNSEAGKINISGTTYQLVKDNFNCIYRGKIDAKNKGEIDMYFVEK